jgi:hypothetical protein
VAFDNKDSIYVYWNDKENGKNMVKWIKTSIADNGDFCNVKDSSFIQTAYYPMSRYNWNLTPSSNDIFAAFNSTVTSFSPIIRRELTCEKVSGFCNPIKINKLWPRTKGS